MQAENPTSKKEFYDNESTLAGSFNRLSEYSTKINTLFGQNRERIAELTSALADATPGVTRLGGQIENVFDIMKSVSEASKRNVIANEETIEKLYAANKLVDFLGKDSKVVLDSFLNIGIGIDQIPEKLEKSINYIRSIGGNTKMIMSDIGENLDKLNRYQFQGGIEGLTKMAAQASMLRFSMKQTFELADKVLDPDKAVEVASAFQRLGVSAGNLVDPFQLMNQSINDPSGLQDSLANVAKQFSYFDESTKTFKINPQGVLIMRELGTQIGIDSKELMEMSIAAKELDRRLSAISDAGLTIASEEDKQYLANIAQMDKDGKYIVTLEDNTKKELTELTQPEFDRLIEAQKTGPKTLEDLARAQLTTSDLIKSDVNSILQKFTYGITGARQVTTTSETLRGISSSTLGTFSSSRPGMETKDLRNGVEKIISDLVKEGKLSLDVKDLKNTDLNDVLPKMTGKIVDNLSTILQNMGGKTMDAFKEIAEKNRSGNETQKKYAEIIESLVKGEKLSIGGKSLNGLIESLTKGEMPRLGDGTTQNTTTNLTNTESSFLFGNSTEQQSSTKTTPPVKPTGVQVPTSSQTTTLQKAEVTFGELKINLSLPTNFNPVTSQELDKILANTFNSSEFKDNIRRIVIEQNPTKAPVKS